MRREIPARFVIYSLALMKHTAIIYIVLSLLVGGAIGYAISQNQATEKPVHAAPNPNPVAVSGTHTMDSSMANMLSVLESKIGDARDINFLEAMIVHHQGAIEMAQIVEQSTKREELKQMAQDITRAQTSEIATMQQWLKEWFGR